jgi:RNA polymerase sigma-70 factor, ECF subfamily
VTQEAFLRLFSALRAGQQVRDTRAWVFSVAHNLALDHCRRAKPFEQLRSEDTARVAPVGPTQALRREQSTRLRAAMRRLSPQERDCLELRAEGLRYRDIADLLKIRISSVESYLARAMKKIAGEIHA